GLIDQILLQGDDSWLVQKLVKEKGYAGQLDGGINALLGNMYNYNGPMLWMASLIHDDNIDSAEIMQSVDEVIATLRNQDIDETTLQRALIKQRSALYSQIEMSSGFGRADLLGSFALFDDDPARINRLEE